MKCIILIAHNLRSAHNVGSLLRTADAMGVSKVYLTGYSPYPKSENDSRLPHLALKIDKNIAKTALGAEENIDWEHNDSLDAIMDHLKSDGFTIAALEQHQNSMSLPEYKAPDKIAIIVGREVEGIEPEILDSCDSILEIPMLGKKESLNVAQAAAIALYHCRFSK